MLEYHQYTPQEIHRSTDETGEVLSDRREIGKERPWKEHKLQSLAVAAAYEALGKSKYERVHNCSNYLNFIECSNDSTHPKRLKRANFCRDRLCPQCNERKSTVIAHQVKKSVSSRIARPKIALYLNLIDLNGEELSRI